MRAHKAGQRRPRADVTDHDQDREEAAAPIESETPSQLHETRVSSRDSDSDMPKRRAGGVRSNVHPLSQAARTGHGKKINSRNKTASYAISRGSKTNKKADAVHTRASDKLEVIRSLMIEQFQSAGFSEEASAEAAAAALEKLVEPCISVDVPSSKQMGTEGFPPYYRGKRVDGNPVDFYRKHWLSFVEARVLYQYHLRKLDPRLLVALRNEVASGKGELSADDPTVIPPPKKQQTEDRLMSADATFAERVRAAQTISTRDSRRRYYHEKKSPSPETTV